MLMCNNPIREHTLTIRIPNMLERPFMAIDKPIVPGQVLYNF